MAGVPLFKVNPWVDAAFYAVLGFLFGVLAERTTYCIVVATHQVMGVKYSKVYEMILVGVAVSSLLTGLLVASGLVPAVDAYFKVPGAGWYTLLGSFIFGFGIMLGQGCMVGMLWKAGQGYLVNWLEIAGMIAGTVIFAFPVFDGLNLNWWWHHDTSLSIMNGAPQNYVPNLLDSFLSLRAAAALTGVIFFAGIMAAALWLRHNRLAWTGGERGKIWSSPYLLGTVFGLFMVASFVFLAGRDFNYLGVTTPVGLLGEYLTAPFGGVLGSASMPNNWFQTVGIASVFTFFILMILSGAMVSAIWRGTFSIRLPARNTNAAAEMAIAFLGGVILAIGARMAQGCSVGGFWSGLAALSLFGLVFTVGFIPGTIAGYYAYVAMSSAAARRVKTIRQLSSIELKVGNVDVSGLVVAVLWSMVLGAVGIELRAFNSALRVHMSPAAVSQWSAVMEVAAVVVLLLAVVGWLRRGSAASR
ncbi:hypothetical protein ASAC_1303 [Acidilobus saccharovorans 345-15]|uniref:Uncharacterized protein n=1 Tax=Acidilobus saccharovorans (strain DSM 16705 / JCM 18335 / VKM B-2471 / 345-15) TaxID=666510 RepID=D9Q320_ACIS3|nr:YeeE/YedE thiosulfate transporter family protein [Acidilobus saccharovorans]ADL19708.1 hypothetical protein ASAC_1303 [Acidilobus saccharovorans 345-15]